MLLRTLYIRLVVYGAIESVPRYGAIEIIVTLLINLLLLLLLLLTTAESVCKRILKIS